MKIYKFLQHDEWPVLIMAKTEAKAKVAELESSNAELLDVLEDFVIDVEGFFSFHEDYDIQPEDGVAYFIGEYRRAKHLIKKEKGTDQ